MCKPAAAFACIALACAAVAALLTTGAATVSPDWGLTTPAATVALWAPTAFFTAITALLGLTDHGC